MLPQKIKVMSTTLTTLHIDMNKYLEKVAERFELEPGVFYDKAKHDVTLSRDKASQEADAADFRKRLGWGAYGGAAGGIVGAAVGHGVSRDHILRRAPYSYKEWVPPTDEQKAAWRASQPTPPTVAKPSMEDYLEAGKIRNPETGKLDFGLTKRQVYKLDAAQEMWRNHQVDLDKWRERVPEGHYRTSTKVPNVKPTIVNKIADKIGAGKARNLFTAGGAAIGGLGLGGLYYAFNSATPAERTAAKDAYITKALKKHDSTINQIEGWE